MKKMKNGGIHMMVPENRVDGFKRKGWTLEPEPEQEPAKADMPEPAKLPKKGSPKPEQEG